MFYYKPCQVNVIQQARLLEGESIYFDMDSIIYADDGTKNVKRGDMTDEISGKGITNFV